MAGSSKNMKAGGKSSFDGNLNRGTTPEDQSNPVYQGDYATDPLHTTSYVHNSATPDPDNPDMFIQQETGSGGPKTNAAGTGITLQIGSQRVDETGAEDGAGLYRAPAIWIDEGGDVFLCANDTQSKKVRIIGDLDVGGEISGGKYWTTFVPTTGSNAVADASEDTLTFTSGDSNIVITGADSPESLDFSLATDITLSGALLTGAFSATGVRFQTPTNAGTPTGTPETGTLVYDTTGNKLWAYDGGWVDLGGIGDHTLDSSAHTDVSTVTDAKGVMLWQSVSGTWAGLGAPGTVDHVLKCTNVDGSMAWGAAPAPPTHDIITSHSDSGLTTGYVIRASSASSFAWAQLSHSDLNDDETAQHFLQSEITALSGITGAIATATNISMSGELDLTGAGALIDLNPSGTGSVSIIDITPSAALIGTPTWKAISINGTALDPGGAATIYGFDMDLSGVDLSNAPNVYGVNVQLPATYGSGTERAGYFSGDGRTVSICDDTYALDISGQIRIDNKIKLTGAWALDIDATGTGGDNIIDIYQGALTTGIWRGFYIDAGDANPSAGVSMAGIGLYLACSQTNDPDMVGFDIVMPTSYGSGTVRAGRFRGNTDEIIFCDGTFALLVDAGDARFDGQVNFAAGTTYNISSTGVATLNIAADDATYTGIVTSDSNVLKYRTKSEVAGDIQGSITALSGITGDIATPVNISMTGQLDMTGASTWIDLNPSGTSGEQNIINITPSAAITGSGNWRGLFVDAGNMDPTLSGTSIYGVDVNFTNCSSSSNPAITGIRARMSGVYGTGDEQAGYFAGDTKIVVLCDATYALHVDAGNSKFDGAVLTGAFSATGIRLQTPTNAGTPTGTPETGTLVYDTTGDKLWAYDGGWVDLGRAGGHDLDSTSHTDVSTVSDAKGVMLWQSTSGAWAGLSAPSTVGHVLNCTNVDGTMTWGAITSLPSMTGAIATPTNISMTGELDMTGASARIDLNPAGSGSDNIIAITPSTALTGTSTWRSIYIDGAALDPSSAATVYGLDMNFSGVSLTNAPNVYGINVMMPGTYGGGTERAGYFSGDGRIVEICNDTYALHVDTGDAKFDDAILTGTFSATGIRVQVPTNAGTPTGTPETGTLVYDTTGDKLWAYDGGWIDLGVGGGTVGGSGTFSPSTIPRWVTDSTTLGDSSIQDDGTDATFTGIANFANGTTYFVDASGNAKFLDTTIVGQLKSTTTVTTGTTDGIVSVIPSSNLSGGNDYNAFYFDGGALDPAASGSIIKGAKLDMSGIGGTSPAIIGVEVLMASSMGSNQYAMYAARSGGDYVIILGPNNSYALFVSGTTWFGSSSYTIDSSGIATLNIAADDATYTGIVTSDSGVLKYRTKSEVAGDIQSGITALSGITGAISTPTNISMSGELDMTGAGALIDLNPSGTGSTNIIDITPSAALIGTPTWKGINIDGEALDPAGAATIYGLDMDLSGVVLTNSPNVYGINIVMPATYGSAEEFAGYFSGDGNIVKICDDTYALWVDDGDSRFDGQVNFAGGTTYKVDSSGNATFLTVNGMTDGEMSQIENIGSTTISLAQWQVVGAFDQDLATTNNVTFASVNGMTDAEMSQIENIGDVTISYAQWGYVGALSESPQTHMSASNPHSASASDTDLSTHASDTSTHGVAQVADDADLHTEGHVLATSGPHTGTLPLTDLEVGVSGDIIIRGAADWEILNKGSDSDILTLSSGVPIWQAVGAPVAHTLDSASHGDVSTVTDAKGVMLWQSVSGTWAGLGAPGTVDYVLKCTNVDGTMAWGALPSHVPASHDIITSHSDSGLTTGNVIRASGVSSFAWAQLSHSDLNDDESTQHLALPNTMVNVLSSYAHSDLSDAPTDAHHNEAHVVDSTGPHSGSGLTTGNVLRVSGATAFAFAQLAHSDLNDDESTQHFLQSAITTVGTLSAGDVSSQDSVGNIGSKASGDIFYWTTSLQRLAKGSDTDVLTLSSGVPIWQAAGAPGSHDLDSASHGDVSAVSDAKGVMLWQSVSGTWAGLGAPGTVDHVLKCTNVDGSMAWGTAPVSGIGGSGTSGTIPRFSAGTTLGDSSIDDDGTDATFSGIANFAGGTTYKVDGSGNATFLDTTIVGQLKSTTTVVTGSSDGIVSIIPSTNLSGGNDYNAIYFNAGALDPAASGSLIKGAVFDLSGIGGTTPLMIGVDITMPAAMGSNQYGLYVSQSGGNYVVILGPNNSYALFVSGVTWFGSSTYKVDASGHAYFNNLDITGTAQFDSTVDIDGQLNFAGGTTYNVDVSGNAVFLTVNGMTDGEMSQIENIGDVTISYGQWGYLGAFDQSLIKAANVEFASVKTEKIIDASDADRMIDFSAGGDIINIKPGSGSGDHYLAISSGGTAENDPLLRPSVDSKGALGDASLSWKSANIDVVTLSGDPTSADHATRKEYVDTITELVYDFLAYGSDNAMIVPLIPFPHFSADAHAEFTPGGMEAVNRLTGNVSMSYWLHLPTNLGTKKLYLKRIAVALNDADSNNEVNMTRIFGGHATSTATLYSHTVNLSSVGEHISGGGILNAFPSDIDCSSYRQINVYLNTNCDTASALDITYVWLECYYA